MKDPKELKRKILKDVRIDVTQKLDRNFERQAFFSDAWKRRKSPVRGDGHILMDSGSLRRSITSRSDDSSITFSSSLPYSAIHNEGGRIKVTRRMKRFFWAKYYEARGSFTRRKDGSLSRSRKQERLSTVAEFWKALALKKVGDEIEIPQRKFIGTSPELEADIKKIIEADIESFMKQFAKEINK